MTLLEAYQKEGLPRSALSEVEAKRYFDHLNDDYKYFAKENDKFPLFYGVYQGIVKYLKANPIDHPELLPKASLTLGAYKLLVYFGSDSIEGILEGVDSFVQDHGSVSEPRYKYTGFVLRLDLPRSIDFEKPVFDLDSWRGKIFEFGYDLFENAMHLSKIEQHLGRVPEKKAEFVSTLPVALYNRASEDMELARVAQIHGQDENSFNIALDYRHGKTPKCRDKEPLPDVSIDLSIALPALNEQIKAKSNFLDPQGFINDPERQCNNQYIVRLPKDNVRYSLAHEKGYNLLKGGISESIYVRVKAKDDFDPTSIDWENFDRDGHEILDAYRIFLVGEQIIWESDLLESDSPTSEMLEAYASKEYIQVIAQELKKTIPYLKLITASAYCTHTTPLTDMGLHFMQIAIEDAEIEKAMESTGGRNCSGSSRKFPVMNIAHARAVNTLDDEYVSSLGPKAKRDDNSEEFQLREFLLSEMVMTQYDDIEQTKQLHAEIKQLAGENPERLDLILQAARHVQTLSDLKYGNLAHLSDEILEFLGQEFSIFVDWKILLDKADGNLTELKKALIKCILKQNQNITEEDFAKIDNLEEAKLDILVENNEFVFSAIPRFVTFEALVAGDTEILDQAISRQAWIGYLGGLDSKEILSADDAFSVRKELFIAMIQSQIQSQNFVVDMSFNMGVVKTFSEAQMNFLDGVDDVVGASSLDLDIIIPLIRYMSEHSEATDEVLHRRLFEIMMSENQIVEEDLLKDISDEQLEILTASQARFHLGQYYDLEFLITLSPEKMQLVGNYSAINLYCKGKLTPQELAEVDNPELLLELLGNLEQFTAAEIQEFDAEKSAILRENFYEFRYLTKEQVLQILDLDKESMELVCSNLYRIRQYSLDIAEVAGYSKNQVEFLFFSSQAAREKLKQGVSFAQVAEEYLQHVTFTDPMGNADHVE